jgi:ferredoxin
MMLKKSNVVKLLAKAAGEMTTYAPLRKEEGDVWFEPLPKGGAELDAALASIALDDEDVTFSAKDIMFPQLETIFRIQPSGFEETVDSSKKLIFGVTPCDLAAMHHVDDFYQSGFKDIYYASRVENRLVVVKGCLKPPRPDACFCTSAGTGPFAEKGYDIQLVEDGDAYHVEVGSDAGREFVSRHKEFFDDSGDASAVTHIKKEAGGKVTLKVDFKKALELMKDEHFEPEEIYKSIGERCIHCGACVYTCPSCTCFTIFDNVKDGEGERVRIWDTCVFEGYTRETSGHNPRLQKSLRASRRYEHKLKHNPQARGSSDCVGCGRCLSHCPVALGMSKFIDTITKGAGQ